MKHAMMLLAAVCLLACVGCQKFTPERYNMVYVGQSDQGVEETLGKPYARFDTEWTYINDMPFYKAIIKFKDRKVVDKSWADERGIGDHPDGNKPSSK